jgi:polysaccharide deacetylase 2 family uncharacterized protein YibQ
LSATTLLTPFASNHSLLLVRIWIASPLATLLLATATSVSQAEPVVAVLIDDVGYEHTQDQRILKLPREVGIAVLPRSPGGAEVAAKARRQKRDVWLHQPLTARSGKSLGPGGIELNMSARKMAEILKGNLTWLGGAIGLNNHMGSAFTAHPEAVDRFAHVLKDSYRDLLIVDSRTDKATVFESTLQKFRLTVTRRNVFLDHENTPAYINRQLDLLIREARKNGTALGIGHPRPATMTVLERRLASLGVRLVSVSDLVTHRAANRR